MRENTKPQVASNDRYRAILRRAHTIAFVGLSDRPERYSNKVARYFIQKGYTIVPVNPNATDILGLPTYATLADIPKDMHLDIIALYRNSNDILLHTQEALLRGNFGVIWLAEGTYNKTAELFAKEHGITLVANLCMMKLDSMK